MFPMSRNLIVSRLPKRWAWNRCNMTSPDAQCRVLCIIYNSYTTQNGSGVYIHIYIYFITLHVTCDNMFYYI